MGGGNEIQVILCTDCTSAMRKFALANKSQLPLTVHVPNFCPECEEKIQSAYKVPEKKVVITLGPSSE
ncbi:hypothetical protein PV-S19_0132 [Pacmanvirus S19]|nr:hypothetical protein PV-S19_0132 [Pacmanvirus S19]